MALSAQQVQYRKEQQDKLVEAATDVGYAQADLNAAKARVERIKRNLAALDVIEGRDA